MLYMGEVLLGIKIFEVKVIGWAEGKNVCWT